MAETLTKPCKCGCGAVIARGNRKAGHFNRQRFASVGCSNRYRNMNDPRSAEWQLKGGKAPKSRDLVTPAEWLDEPPARIRVQRQAQGIVL